MVSRRRVLLGLALCAVAVAAGCGGGSSSSSGSGGSGGSSSTASGSPQKGGTFTILANSNFGVADPAQNYTLQQWALLITTHDGLVGFKRAGGTAGTELVPDLATEIPEPTDGGKTYAFQLRDGIKYSDGTPLKASDFVTVFTRQFTVPGPANGFYAGIVGGEACLKNSKTCDMKQGVVADDSANTLTIHLTAPDPEFLDKLALPFAFAVPGNTSLKLTGNDVPPGTGPYMWQSYNPNKSAVLVRNPNFKEWSAEAQPDGNPDSIVEKFGLPVTDAVTAVENGSADAVFAGDSIPADRLNEIDTQYADQTHVNALTADWYFALNVNEPPFDNLQARQAINFAADRTAYVKIAGGPSLAVPTCQILPPNFPGYEPYCPYTAGADSDNTKWTGVDLTKAKDLVDQSGTKGAKVVVVGTTDEVGKALALQMVSDLKAIGYDASAKLLASGPQYAVRPELRQSRPGRMVGLVPGLSGSVGLPERAARLRLVPPAQRRQPEHRGLLRQGHPGQDGPGLGDGRHRPRGSEQALGRSRPRRDRPGSVGRPLQPEADRLPVQAGAGLPVEPAVVPALRPALAEPVAGRAVTATGRGARHERAPAPMVG